MGRLQFTTRNSYSSSLYEIEEFGMAGTCAVQEDATGCRIDGNTSVMVLCDGIGSLARGDLAARAAVRNILQLTSEYAWKDNPVEFLKYLLAEANEAVFSLKDEHGKPVRGGCTLVVVLTDGRRLYLANTGDSRAYLIRKDGIHRLTEDHNFSGMLRRALACGEISEEEYAANIARGAALTGYLGLEEIKEHFVCSGPLLLDRDEVVLLESDGLYKLVSEEEIFRIVRSNVRTLEAAGTELLTYAENRAKTYQDNTSVLLFRIK